MMEHTPGPWEAHCMGSEGYIIKPKHGDIRHKGKRLALIGMLEWEQDKSNAEFIVHACNSHDDLLEACKIALSLLPGPQSHDYHKGPTLADDVKRIEQAITKAEGK